MMGSTAGLRVGYDDDFTVIVQPLKLRFDQLHRFRFAASTNSGTDQGQCDGPVSLVLGKPNGVSDGTSNGGLRRDPQHVDTSHVDDRLEGQSSGRSFDSTSYRNGPCFGQLSEGRIAGLFSYRTGDTLRNQQPPRDYIPVLGIDDYFDILSQQITLYQLDFHRSLAASASCSSGRE